MNTSSSIAVCYLESMAKIDCDLLDKGDQIARGFKKRGPLAGSGINLSAGFNWYSINWDQSMPQQRLLGVATEGGQPWVQLGRWFYCHDLAKLGPRPALGVTARV